jgi:2-phosphosulfolactate phosphatase
MTTIEVHLTPADFAALQRRNLDDAACVVFDVFRATTTMVTALANGAVAIIPVAEISDALAVRQWDPSVLLAGERDGLRIRSALSGGVDFDLGNSPREFTREKVAGRTVVMTTTNGTRALRSCAHASGVLVASFLNLPATARFLARRRPSTLLLVCSGTLEQASLEDVLGAGALCDLLWNDYEAGAVSDSALMARSLYQSAQHDLPEAACRSRNGRRLLGIPELKEDVAFCLQRDAFGFVAALRPDGQVRRFEG